MYALFKDSELAKQIISLFVSSSTYTQTVNGADLLFIFGIGGMILILAFAASYFLRRHTLRLGADDELRSFYAAVTCAFMTLVLYSVLEGIVLDARSLMIAVSSAALYSAVSKSR